jgi:hypothetical protein
MKKIIIALALTASVVGLVLLVTAWGGESSETAKQNYCNSLSDLSATVMSYQGLDPLAATNDEMEAAADDISAAYDDVVDEAYDWAYADDNALTAAYDDLYYAIEDLPGDNTMAENLNDLEDELAAFPAAFHETFDGSGCTTTTA